MTVTASLSVLVGASLGPLQKGLKKGAGLLSDFSAKASKLSVGGGGIGAAIAGALGGVSLAAGLKVAVDRFKDVENAGARMNAALALSGQTSTATTAKVMALGQQLSTTTKTSKAATLDAAATIAAIGMVKGDALVRATKIANDLGAALGKDGPAAEQLAHALRDPSEGYLELAKAGIGFNSAQIETIQSLQASGDLLGAQQALMDAVAASTEGAAEAAGKTLSGRLDILSNSFDNVASAVGEVLAPAIKSGVDQLTAWVAGLDTVANRQKLWDYTIKAAGFVADAVQAIGIAWKYAAADMADFVANCASGFTKVVELINKLIRAANKLGAGLKEIDTKGIKAFEQGAWGDVDKANKDAAKAWAEPWRSSPVVETLKATQTAGVKAMESIGVAATRATGTINQLTDRQIAAQDEATKLIRELEIGIKSFGQMDYARRADQLGTKGSSADQVEKVRKLGAKSEGQQLAKSLENPLEKFQREMKNLERLRADGGVDDKTYARQQAALTRDLASAVPKISGTAGGPLQAGGQEAYAALMSFRSAGMNTAATAAERIAQAELSQLQQVNRWMQMLVKATPSIAQFAGL